MRLPTYFPQSHAGPRRKRIPVGAAPEKCDLAACINGIPRSHETVKRCAAILVGVGLGCVCNLFLGTLS